MNPTAPKKIFGRALLWIAFATLLLSLFPGAVQGDKARNIIDTVAGSYPAPISAAKADLPGPPSAAVDRFGNIYIATFEGNTVLKMSPSGEVTPFAGNGIFGFSGDNGPAKKASLALPIGVAVDGAGNVFIADEFNDRIRRVDAKTKKITTYAGNGIAGFSGDGGPATSASINIVNGVLAFGSPVALDGSGNLFIADIHNQRVRRVDVGTGIITTVAGNGTPGFGGDGGPAVSAELNSPSSLAVTSTGTYFINDSNNFLIRRVDGVTGIITTYVGNGGIGFCGDGGPAANACLFFPEGLAVDSAGDLFIADTFNERVRRVDGSTQIITTVAGNGFAGFSGDGGPATAAELNLLNDVAVESAGDVLIADTGNNRIRRISANNQVINTVAGGGTGGDGGRATEATLADPFGVAADAAGNIFLSDTANNRIRKVNIATGRISTVAGNGLAGFSGDNGPATSASLNFPQSGLAVDNTDNVFFGDFLNFVVRRVDGGTGVITTVAGNEFPCFPSTAPCGDGGLAIDANLLPILDVALDSSGDMFICDGFDNRIRRVDAVSGIITTVAGNGNAGYSGDGGLATSAELNLPFGVNVDSSGNLFIADAFNNRIRRVDAITGMITTVAGNGVAGYSGDGGPATSASVNFPINASVDSAGNLFIADSGNSVVRYVAASTGIISTIAGTGVFGFSGDGGPATEAMLDFFEIALDPFGNVLIADAGNQRIRRFKFTPGSGEENQPQRAADVQGQQVQHSWQPSFATARLAIAKARLATYLRLLQACQAGPNQPACARGLHF